MNIRVMIWKCGDYGHRILTQIVQMNDIEIVGYVDSNPDFWGKSIGMFKIYNPESIKGLNLNQVLIAINNPADSLSIKHNFGKWIY